MKAHILYILILKENTLKSIQRVLNLVCTGNVVYLLPDFKAVGGEGDGNVLLSVVDHPQKSECKHLFKVLLADLRADFAAEHNEELSVID